MISVSFWLLCTAIPYFLPKSIPINLPTSALMFFTPMLAALVLVYMGSSIPDPQFPILLAPVLFVAFFVAAAGEEIGWQGYAFEPLHDRWNALDAAVILGIVWAVWHVVPFIQTHNTPTWIFWQCVFTVGLRILIVWLYNNTGMSVFAAIIFHAMPNVSAFMFPNYGSHYDPFIASVLIWITVAIVIFLWGTETLARYKFIDA